MINQIPPIEIFEGFIYIISSILFILGIFLSLLIYKKKKNLTTVFLILMMIGGFLFSFSNIFERFDLWEEADEFGDSFFMFFATILLIIGLVVILEEKLQTSEKKFRNAFMRSNFYKDLFTHDMSNIVQNIMTSLELYIEIKNSPKGIKRAEEILELLNEQSIRGVKLISNVRKLSKMDGFKIKTMPMDLYSVLYKTIKYIKRSQHNKNIQINLEIQDRSFNIYANEFLTDIFENILINAINHNKNSIIEILVRISEEKKEERNYVKLEFIDNGYGISDDRKNLIFNRDFEKGHSSKGMGIGLSLVKEIVESYNGEIKVENRVKEDYNRGSNFILKFPLNS